MATEKQKLAKKYNQANFRLHGILANLKKLHKEFPKLMGLRRSLSHVGQSIKDLRAEYQQEKELL